jgi:prepilin-type N-terminal cleavage/methylation domain-containing protein
MAKIITQNNKGLTLIELLIYMSIFSIIFSMITSSVFYLQKIIQNNNQNYYIKNRIYFNLNILQQYLYSSGIEVVNNDLKIFDKNNSLILTQKIENKQIKNIYQNKNFIIDGFLNFEKYTVSSIDKGRVLRFDISWVDSRGKVQNLTEYLIVINLKM